MLELQNIPNANPWDNDDIKAFCKNTFHFSRNKEGPYTQGNLDTNAVGSNEKRALPDPLRSNSTTVTVGSRRRKAELVVSHHKGQSAMELCNSHRSRGPDFVSVSEGKYCDMTNKILYPLCSDGVKRDCFSVDQDSQRMKKGRQSRGKGQRVHSRYDKVVNWGTKRLLP